MLDILEKYNNQKQYKSYYLDFIKMIDLYEKKLKDNYVYCMIDKNMKLNTYGVEMMKFTIFDYSESFREFHEIYLEGSTDMMELVYALSKLKIVSNYIVVKFISLGKQVWRKEFVEMLLLGDGVIIDKSTNIDISTFIKLSHLDLYVSNYLHFNIYNNLHFRLNSINLYTDDPLFILEFLKIVYFKNPDIFFSFIKNLTIIYSFENHITDNKYILDNDLLGYINQFKDLYQYYPIKYKLLVNDKDKLWRLRGVHKRLYFDKIKSLGFVEVCEVRNESCSYRS